MWRWFSHESSPTSVHSPSSIPFTSLHSDLLEKKVWGSVGGLGPGTSPLRKWACLYPAVGDGTGQACSKKTHTQAIKEKERKKGEKRWNIIQYLHSNVDACGSQLQTRWPWSDKHEIKMKNVQSESRKMGLSASSAGNKPSSAWSLTTKPSLLHGSREPPMNYSSRLSTLLRFELIPGAICCCLRAMQRPPPSHPPADACLWESINSMTLTVCTALICVFFSPLSLCLCFCRGRQCLTKYLGKCRENVHHETSTCLSVSFWLFSGSLLEY